MRVLPPVGERGGGGGIVASRYFIIDFSRSNHLSRSLAHSPFPVIYSHFVVGIIVDLPSNT